MCKLVLAFAGRTYHIVRNLMSLLILIQTDTLIVFMKEYAQYDQSLCMSLEYSMTTKLLTEHDLEFLSLKGGCIASSESTLVKMPHC